MAELCKLTIQDIYRLYNDTRPPCDFLTFRLIAEAVQVKQEVKSASGNDTNMDAA